MAYSEDLRIKVMEYIGKGHSQREAQKVFNINLETINRWHQKYRQTGEIKDKKPCRGFKKVDPKKLEVYVQEYPDAYLKEIGEVFNCTDMSIHRALKKLGITRKKRQKGIGSKSGNK
jgi:transposase